MAANFVTRRETSQEPGSGSQTHLRPSCDATMQTMAVAFALYIDALMPPLTDRQINAIGKCYRSLGEELQSLDDYV